MIMISASGSGSSPICSLVDVQIMLIGSLIRTTLHLTKVPVVWFIWLHIYLNFNLSKRRLNRLFSLNYHVGLNVFDYGNWYLWMFKFFSSLNFTKIPHHRQFEKMHFRVASKPQNNNTWWADEKCISISNLDLMSTTFAIS